MNKFYMEPASKHSFKRVMFRAVIITLLLAAVNPAAWAQVNLTNATPSVTIDFSNSMPTSVGTNPSTAFTAAGFQPNPATAGRLNSNAWSFTGWSDGTLGFNGTQTTGDFARGTVTAAVPSTGGVYSYTGTEAGASAANPILLLQPIGADFTPGTIVLKVHNSDGTQFMNQLTITYKIYVRNDQARSNGLYFSYSADNVTYTSVTTLDYASPTTADGLGLVLAATKTYTITGIAVLPGSDYYIRWTGDDISGAGNRDEFGLDDIVVTGAYVAPCTEPTVNASLSNIDNLFCTQMDFEFQRGNGTGGLMIVATGGPSAVALSTAPTSGITYHANPNYGTGDPVGNGFVVYNSGSVAANGIGSFTITGLTPGYFYRFYYFEYNISVPCYFNNSGAWISYYDEQQTPAPCSSPSTGYYRSTAGGGNWADCRTWQSSPDNIFFSSADQPPTSASAGISIIFTHTVDISSPASMDQVGIDGTLTLSTDGVINLNNGAGADIDVRNGGVLKILSAKNYSSSFAYTGGPTINVATGGKITVGNGGATPGYSPLGYTSGLCIWNTGSVFEWNTTDPFITSGVTYFPDANAATIPIFRVSKTPSLQPGANANTTWNGKMEVNSILTLKLAGLKTFRNGIIGTADLFQDDNCGQFIISGTADLGGTGTLYLNSSNDATYLVAPASVTTLKSNKSVVQIAGVGKTIVDGTLMCDNFVLGGNAPFTLSSGGTLGIGSIDGITISGTAAGNIQSTGARSYSTGGNYIYNGTANQVTGTGLPATVNTLTIANTGGSGNNTVTNTRAGTTTISSATTGALTLTSGLFSIGASKDITISDNGGITATAGNFSASSSGSVTFVGTGTVSGPIDFYPDVYQTPVGIKGVNYGSSSVLHGLLQLNAGSFVNINAPTYLSTSLLKYNTGALFNRNVEWSTGSGNGYPYHVQVSNNTTIDPTGTALSFNNTIFKAAGNVTIDNGSAIYMDYSGHNMLVPLTVLGNLNINGAISGSGAVGGDIEVYGNWVRSSTGSYFPNNRAVFFKGTGNSTITANNGETFHYLYFAKSVVGNTVTLNDNIRVTKEFGINTGTLDLTSKDVTLASSAAATATFANFGAGTPANASVNYSGTGRFVVERYIPSGASHLKTWQFLAVPTNNAGAGGGQTINASWQEGNAALGNTAPGYGTIISNNTAGAGFDIIGGVGPSMKTYVPASNNWAGVANTTGTEIYNQKGYMLFVRGDRSVQTYNGTANATTLRTRGKIMEAGSNPPPVTNVGANQFESVGNPYASSVDFTLLTPGGGLDNKFYVWDPTLSGSYGLGGYQTMSSATGWIPSSAGTTNYPAATAVKTIQSGQAFFVHATGSAGSLTFTESAKQSGSSIVFRPVDVTGNRYIRTALYTNNGLLADGHVLSFNGQFSNDFDRDDAIKMLNGGENLGSLCSGKLLSVEARLPVAATDTVFYQLSNLRQQEYEFRFMPENMIGAGLDATLIDRFLLSRTAISLSEPTNIRFLVTDDPNSADAGRFILVFSKAVAVKFISIHATMQAADVLVDWKALNLQPIDHYEIERSTDGIHFGKIGEVLPQGNTNTEGSYSLLDKSAKQGDNYYRIRCVDRNGQSVFSATAKINIPESGEQLFVVSPNPVKSNVISLLMNNPPVGNYTFALYNLGSQLLFSRQFNISVQAGAQTTIPLVKPLGKAVYQYIITGPAGFCQPGKLMVE